MKNRYLPLCSVSLAAIVASTPMGSRLVADSQPPFKKRGVAENVVHGGKLHLDRSPSDRDLFKLAVFPEPLVPTTEGENALENERLGERLRRFLQREKAEDYSDLEAFIEENPDSRWNLALRVNLGSMYFSRGYLSRAMAAWEEAWRTGRELTHPNAIRLTDKALSELAVMHARIGRTERLGALLEAASARSLTGASAAMLACAQEGYATMLRKPGVSFRCGPYSLATIQQAVSDSTPVGVLSGIASPREGFSLKAVKDMSDEVGLGLQAARREPGAVVIAPSVMHWKVGHFGALLKQDNGKFVVKDPTFGLEVSVSEQVIDSEGSGYFLVPKGPLPDGWVSIENDEASTVFGKGHSGNSNPRATKPCSHTTGGSAGGSGGGGFGGPVAGGGDPNGCGAGSCSVSAPMAQYAIHTMLVSLSIYDTPVGYSPAYGPDLHFQVRYNQKEAFQPASFNFSYFSPSWVNDWVSYLEDDPANPGDPVELRLRGGGSEQFTDFDAGAQEYAPDDHGVRLAMIASNRYELRYPDGSVDEYAHYIGSTGPKRKVFLSKVIDAAGNEVTLGYDTNDTQRLSYMLDAAGLQTDLYYNDPSDSYLITQVEDPYGRSAYFHYGDVAGVRRLTNIVDVIGIESTFFYDSSGFITNMTTPYGPTAFESFNTTTNYGTNGLNAVRWIEVTDAYGDKERVEFNVNSATGVTQGLTEPAPDDVDILYATYDMNDRNTYYWDKEAMHAVPGQYTNAYVYHWLQPDSHDVSSGILESEKPPLESRTWYNYPGQVYPEIKGTLALPSKVARVLDLGGGSHTTQLFRYEYDLFGNVTNEIDPVGRQTIYSYATNGVDLLEVRQKTSTGEDILTTYTYAEPSTHQPLSITDAAGQATHYTYDAAGNVLSITNPLGQAIHYRYETNLAADGYGKLLEISGDLAGGATYFSYDGYDRVDTTSNEVGYVLTYNYDTLDRITKVTYPDGTFEAFTYDQLDRATSRDREGKITRYFYDALRRLVAEQDPAGRIIQYRWCRCGDLRKLVDPNGNETEWVRDLQGRVAAKRYADGSEIDYAYDSLGRLVLKTDAKGQETHYAYSMDNNIVELDFQNEEHATPTVSYAFDPHYNRITSMVDGVGTTLYAYHANSSNTLGAGQLASTDGPWTNDTVIYDYDELGRVTNRAINGVDAFVSYDAEGRIDWRANRLGTSTYHYVTGSAEIDSINLPHGLSIDYAYFGNSGDRRLSRIEYLDAATNTLARHTYAYATGGNITNWTQQSGAASPSTYTFDYDAAEQLLSAVMRDSTNGLLASYGYDYDPAGNRTLEQIDEMVTSANHNELNQLISHTGGGSVRFRGTVSEFADVAVGTNAAAYTRGSNFTFDASVTLAAGTSTVQVVATDMGSNTVTNEYELPLTAGDDADFYYDLNGNLTSIHQQASSIVFEWDALDRLISWSESTNRAEFAYDGQDRRVIIRDISGSLTNEKQLLWCGNQICQERDDNGTVAKHFFNQGFERLTGTNAGVYFYGQDHLGSVRELIDTTGVIQTQYDYDPWGRRTKVSGGVDSDFGYTLHYYHEASTLTFARYRAYRSGTGRWLSRDRMSAVGPDGPNVYAYAVNNPVRNIDPLGLASELPPTMWDPTPGDPIPWPDYREPDGPLYPPDNYSPYPNYNGFPTWLACMTDCMGLGVSTPINSAVGNAIDQLKRTCKTALKGISKALNLFKIPKCLDQCTPSHFSEQS